MIRKYTFGTPLSTDAVVLSLPAESGPLPFFSLSTEGSRVILSRELHPEDCLFGLGESVRGINKRGFLYRSWNSDVFNHTESTESLYASHNFLVFFGPGCLFGIYADDPGCVTWDLGYTRSDTAVITSENGQLDLYVLEEESLTELARSFRRLTGRSYLPPRWAFGYIQSRWGYASEAEVRAVAGEHRKRGIPLDGVCLDIDYMEDFRNFTWRKDAFPDLKHFSEDMKRDHIRLLLERAARQKTIPIVNYNDPVSDEENRKMELAARRRQGEEVHECVDNDETAAVIANLVHAKVLVLMTSTEGIYRVPGDQSTLVRDVLEKDPEALEREVRSLQESCVGASRAGANGARAKLEYALESARNGTTVIIGHARHRISDLVEGRVPCTRIGLI